MLANRCTRVRDSARTSAPDSQCDRGCTPGGIALWTAAPLVLLVLRIRAFGPDRQGAAVLRTHGYFYAGLRPESCRGAGSRGRVAGASERCGFSLVGTDGTRLQVGLRITTGISARRQPQVLIWFPPRRYWWWDLVVKRADVLLFMLIACAGPDRRRQRKRRVDWKSN